MSYYYNFKAVYSGKRLETYHYSLAQERGYEARNKNGRKGKSESTKDKEKNRREVLNRARNKIIRLINCNEDLETFITLTYAENMQDLGKSKEDINRCVKKLQRENEKFKYLYVLEYQERGAIHYHMLCNYDVEIKTAESRRKKTEKQKEIEQKFRRYWPYGYVDIRNLKQEGNTNAGLYVSAYLVEDLLGLELNGAKCYGYSRNLKRPREETMLVNKDYMQVFEEMREHYEPHYHRAYDMVREYDEGIKIGTVNYFDYYRR